MTNSLPGTVEADSQGMPIRDEQSEQGSHEHHHPHHHRRRKKKRMSRRARLKRRYAFILAVLVCVGLGYLLYNLNQPVPPVDKFDASKYRNEFLKRE